MAKSKLILNPDVSDSDVFAIPRRLVDQYTTGALTDRVLHYKNRNGETSPAV